MTANHRALDAADIALIEKVRGTPSLYDSTNADFKFAYRKEQLWEQVSVLLGMTAVDARRRWTCLRDRYSRELKQMRMHPEKNEYGNNDFFRQMDFLRKFVRKRRERRRVDAKFKYDSSWDGSNDDNSKMPNKSEELTVHSEEDLYDETQDQYDAKLEVTTTTDATDNYPEFVEDAHINSEGYVEEYVEQHPAETTTTSTTISKYGTITSGATTPRHSAVASNSNTLSNVIPIAFLNHVTAAGTGRSNSYTLTTNSSQHKPSSQITTSERTKQRSPELTSIASAGCSSGAETEDDFFCKTIGSYLRQLSRRHKIKAKVEMFQILEKYIELEEDPADMYSEDRKGC